MLTAPTRANIPVNVAWKPSTPPDSHFDRSTRRRSNRDAVKHSLPPFIYKESSLTTRRRFALDLNPSFVILHNCGAPCRLYFSLATVL